MYGGRPVRVLNMGTNINMPIPSTSIDALPRTGAAGSTRDSPKSPFNVNDKMINGTNRQITLGKNKVRMIFTVVICPPIQSIVVVTSPIGVHAPPAFAAITTIPAKNRRMSLLGISLRISDTITIAVVRLSSIDERKKLTQQMIQRSVLGFFVRILSVMMLKPW